MRSSPWIVRWRAPLMTRGLTSIRCGGNKAHFRSTMVSAGVLFDYKTLQSHRTGYISHSPKPEISARFSSSCQVPPLAAALALPQWSLAHK